MNPAELERIREAARAAAASSRHEQGLPPKIADPLTLERVAALFRDPAKLEEAA